jgi:uncharacterized membrane protein
MKKRFITGVVVTLPIGIVVFVLWFLIVKIGGILSVIFNKIPNLENLPSIVVSLIGFLTLIIVIYIIGCITSSYIGNKLLQIPEFILSKLPVIRILYGAAKKITTAIFIDKSAFKKAVIIEYPRKGIYTLAFITNEGGFRVTEEKEYVNLFIPTTPNPTSGIYIVAPKKELIDPKITIDEALQTIISGGVIIGLKKGGKGEEKRKKEKKKRI